MTEGPPRTAPLGEGAGLAPGVEAIAHLRRGHDCDVYDAWNEERDCRCVAKLLRPERRRHPRARRRLREEGRLLLSLSHPHIVRAYELVERPDPVLVLEAIDGETVEHLLARRRQRLPSTDVAFLGMHLCSAAQYLHRRGIVHLDLKPSNVISDGGQAKLIDLSIARRPGRGRQGVGTRQYMAPEQVRGGRVGPATDVWGIGAVLFEAATAVRPFGDGVAAHLNGHGPPSVSPSVGDHRRLPRELASAIDACLDPEAARRPKVMDLSKALDRVALAALDDPGASARDEGAKGSATGGDIKGEATGSRL